MERAVAEGLAARCRRPGAIDASSALQGLLCVKDGPSTISVRCPDYPCKRTPARQRRWSQKYLNRTTLAANVGAFVLPFANLRHAHEFRCFKKYPLRDDQLLVAGVIDSLTNFVEHPQVVADRLERVAEVVGDPTRVLAGTDCGFDTSAGWGRVAENVVGAKRFAAAVPVGRPSRRRKASLPRPTPASSLTIGPRVRTHGQGSMPA